MVNFLEIISGDHFNNKMSFGPTLLNKQYPEDL